ncbi:hypothetical protein JHD50_10960 [Sulfurimonas sp. MAG313]|nr:hypothetical protein [Sulfurimonas sp. MAG313]MDF1881812.1 hypothetical protein [Sulfurimonas sp. MAG313]
MKSIIVSALIAFILIGCGSSGITDIPGDSGTNPVVVEEPVVAPTTLTNAEDLFNTLRFTSGSTYNRQFSTPTFAQGGSLNIPNEMAITSQGVSSFTISPSIEAGQYVQAYVYTVPSLGRTIIVPIGANGQALSSGINLIQSQSDSFESPSLAPTLRTGYTQTCFTSAFEDIIINGSSRTRLDVAVEVRAFIGSSTSSTDIASLVASMEANANNQLRWTAPSALTVSATDVGTGELQVTLTWDKA